MLITLGTRPGVELGFFYLLGEIYNGFEETIFYNEQIKKLEEHGGVVDDVERLPGCG